MARLNWIERNYESGIDRGVLYPKDGPGEVWNGLMSIVESPSESNEKTRYIDGVKTHYRRTNEEFSGTIEALSYPNSFYEHVLTQKRYQNFGMSYRTQKDKGHYIHVVYNVSISPASYDHEQTESDPFSWAFTTKAIPVPGAKASAHLVIDTSKAYSWTVDVLEGILYGDDVNAARIPTPQEILDIFEANSILRVTDHGDGTFTVTGPNDAIQMLDPTTFQITWPSAIYIDEVSYMISSL